MVRALLLQDLPRLSEIVEGIEKRKEEFYEETKMKQKDDFDEKYTTSTVHKIQYQLLVDDVNKYEDETAFNDIVD